MARKRNLVPTYDPATVNQYARGRWRDILSELGGIDSEFFDGKHHPCPHCGGTDRFRFTDRDGEGSLLCNQCFKPGAGDGLAALEWLRGCKFAESLRLVADYLGVQPATADNGKHRSAKNADPEKHLKLQQWSELLAATWCLQKQPITPAAILAAHGCLARYRQQFTVVDVPIFGEKLDAAKPVGHALYNVSGGTLPSYTKEGKSKQNKILNTYGSEGGLVGNVERLKDATIVWKVEGVSDCLAVLSLPDLPPDVAVVSNAMGAGERPKPWMLEVMAGKVVYVAGDRDANGAGEAGARRWSAAISGTASECRWCLPPEGTKDVREWIVAGATYRDLAEAGIAGQLPSDDPTGGDTGGHDADSGPLEAEDDPHRLARVNLEQYSNSTGGRLIRFWRGEWYTWRRTHYRKVSHDEFRAKLSWVIKQEFNRIHLAQRENGTDEEDRTVRKVTPHLVSAVASATAGLPDVLIPESVELMSWIPTRQRRNLLSAENGLVDIDAILADKPKDEWLIPHSHDWFSTVAVPYEFDPEAQCPKWEAFLEKVLEYDPERYKVLQEWTGYLLTPDTRLQKCLVMEGEGANGKSTYIAGVKSLIGEGNYSSVGIEAFSDRFSKTMMVGKLVNISPDTSEIDRMAEGFIKSMCSGDTILFDRKCLPPLECRPTARLMIACNQIPRITDRSQGVWRRIQAMPWSYRITDEERVIGMDDPQWWIDAGECPGILNWAIEGLYRLRRQQRFTFSEACENLLQEHRSEMNPARMFLIENTEESDNGQIRSTHLYQCYKRWIAENGYKPLSERQFFKEVKRQFRNVDRKRGGPRNARFYFYSGIQFSQEEICGERVTDERLF